MWGTGAWNFLEDTCLSQHDLGSGHSIGYLAERDSLLATHTLSSYRAEAKLCKAKQDLMIATAPSKAVHHNSDQSGHDFGRYACNSRGLL